MPGKSRHVKGKHPHQSKKSKAIMRQAGTNQRQEAPAAATKIEEPVKAPALPKADTAKEAVAAIRYPYVTWELKRIGILAGIIIVVLIVLSIIL